MIKIKILREHIQVTTSDDQVFSLKRDALDDLHQAIHLIKQLPQTDIFEVLEITLQ